MNITINIIYNSSYDNKLSQIASFPVNSYQFKKDPDQEAARVAFNWWEIIKNHMSYLVTIYKVTYNDTHDITELVKRLDDAPIPDIDLPF